MSIHKPSGIVRIWIQSHTYPEGPLTDPSVCSLNIGHSLTPVSLSPSRVDHSLGTILWPTTVSFCDTLYYVYDKVLPCVVVDVRPWFRYLCRVVGGRVLGDVTSEEHVLIRRSESSRTVPSDGLQHFESLSFYYSLLPYGSLYQWRGTLVLVEHLHRRDGALHPFNLGLRSSQNPENVSRPEMYAHNDFSISLKRPQHSRTTPFWVILNSLIKFVFMLRWVFIHFGSLWPVNTQIRWCKLNMCVYLNHNYNSHLYDCLATGTHLILYSL